MDPLPSEFYGPKGPRAPERGMTPGRERLIPKRKQKNMRHALYVQRISIVFQKKSDYHSLKKHILQFLPSMFEDIVTSFQLETSAVRGRFVRLRPSVEDILTPHGYPPVVNRQLSEMMAVAVALAASFKSQGIFTLQIHGDGPIHLMVVDVIGEGEIRACARFDEAALPPYTTTLPSIPQLFGNGSLIFSITQGLETGDENKQYQGVVELNAKTLVECMYHFFRQSEQISTGMVVFSQDFPLPPGEGGYVASALFLQRLSTESREDNTEHHSQDQDNWFHTLSLLGTVKPFEVLHPGSSSLEILYKLFWEQGVRVFESHSLEARCRCSKERVLAMIRHFPENEREALLIDNQIDITCEFCSAHYLLLKQEVFA